ncbi:MAG: TonB-dependent receptor plug domain-containing protein, partial [Bacteroidales bacterium]|nr:TonB-dependent receptor plug domain-containing protein [Bacteroidales bacterium]
MKILRVLSVVSILICLYSPSTLSQTPKSNKNTNDALQYRKLYLHTDREQYFLSDTIWYKAYYLDGRSNSFVSGLITMYVDVIDEAGESVLDQVLAIDNGVAHGAIGLLSSLDPGNYIIRAFTDFQKSLGEDAFFHKQVRISKLESFVEGSAQTPSQHLLDIDVAFLPEGGMLLGGQMNTLGVKAIDTHGSGISIQGEVLDSKGASVAAFTTSYKGMTSIQLVPQRGETYTISLADHPDYTYVFDDIVEAGVKIEFDRETSSDLLFRAVTNAESLKGRTYYFAISHHGEVIFHKKFVPKNSSFPITVKKDALPAGINRMVLLDEQLLPISERLYFSTNYQINEIKIKPDKQNYETRSRVRLRLSEGRGVNEDSWSNLSMVVVDEFSCDKEGPSMNILSWLLIDSELKGHIESPLDYFSDDPEIASATKLDLLMLTQGWSRYIWNEPRKYLASESKEEEGFALSGKVRKVIGNKPVTDGTVELKVYNNNFMHVEKVELDEEGRFVFKDVNFLDTASVFIQAKNKRDRLAFQISLDSVFNDFPLTSAKFLPKEELLVPKQADLYQKQFDKLQALKEYTLKSGSFYLEEVTITEHSREPDDGHFRIYPKPFVSIEITERDLTYMSVLDYLPGHFAGVTLTSAKNVIIHGPSSFGGGEANAALLILDGFPVGKEAMMSIPMSDIDRVEVLKNPAETAIFGVNGGKGVVSVFTKRGGVPDYSDKYIPGTIAMELKGYSSNREFYSPKYSKENINSERPDHRIVQFWEPNIFTEKGKASVSFFSSDDITRYKIYVEGITRDG